MNATSSLLAAIALLLFGSGCGESESSGPADHDEHGHSHGAPGLEGGAAHATRSVTPATADSPELIRLAPGITLVEDLARASAFEGSVFTHEGHFSPLLFGEEMRAFSIRLEAGMFLAEHPHPNESFVFTARGKWVLCSGGNRQVMETGSVFHFASEAPTGWEAPFEGGADLYIVKRKKPGEDFASYTKGLRSLAERLDREYQEGGEFYYRQLAPEHPAIAFALEHSPAFEGLLAEWSRKASSEE